MSGDVAATGNEKEEFTECDNLATGGMKRHIRCVLDSEKTSDV